MSVTTFQSILFERLDGNLIRETLEAPVFFVDLNLDQIINAIIANKESYNLKPFFYTPLQDACTIQYRHEIMQELENETRTFKLSEGEPLQTGCGQDLYRCILENA